MISFILEFEGGRVDDVLVQCLLDHFLEPGEGTSLIEASATLGLSLASECGVEVEEIVGEEMGLLKKKEIY